VTLRLDPVNAETVVVIMESNSLDETGENFLATPAQFFKDPDQRQLLARGPGRIPCQQSSSSAAHRPSFGRGWTTRSYSMNLLRHMAGFSRFGGESKMHVFGGVALSADIFRSYAIPMDSRSISIASQLCPGVDEADLGGSVST